MKRFFKAWMAFCSFLLLIATTAQAQTPELVKGSITIQSTPLDVSGAAFFVATVGAAGREIWTSDGTADGTKMVRDLTAGATGSGIKYYNNLGLCPLGSELIFVADNGTYGYELWKSDGTEAGTGLIKNIRAGTGNGVPSNWGKNLAYNGYVYTAGDNGTTGWELWRSDGTPGGTTLFKNIRPGTSGSNPNWFTIANGTFYFVANDGTAGAELWKTDGSPENTAMVKNIQPGSSARLWPYVSYGDGRHSLFCRRQQLGPERHVQQ